MSQKGHTKTEILVMRNAWYLTTGTLVHLTQRSLKYQNSCGTEKDSGTDAIAEGDSTNNDG